MLALVDGLSNTHLVLLILALGVVFVFEFVNGFHDTANAVATVIYTNSLPPWVAVLWSGCCNFLGVYLGGVAVAFSIVHLLPVDLLININTHAGLVMVFALLISAIVWNFGTWYLALPSSSSHSLIGSILGVGIAHGLMTGKQFGSGVNWVKAQEVGLTLLVSPIVGFALAFGLLRLTRWLIPHPELYSEPQPGVRPPGWIRAILVLTCTGVSFAHGSNDGQKGVGMVMLILIGLLPAHYAINRNYDRQQVITLQKAADELAERLSDADGAESNGKQSASAVRSLLGGQSSFESLDGSTSWELRTAILKLSTAIKEGEAVRATRQTPEQMKQIEALRREMIHATEYAPDWVLLAVALSLGIGTTIGWKRIVVTIGEKIGKTHLTYGQGACAELVAMGTIGLADAIGFPVSTTHVLSSAVAGTMAANRSGVQFESIRKIVLAWVLTLPATMLLSGTLLWLFDRWRE